MRHSKRPSERQATTGAVLDTARGIAMAGVIYAHVMQILSVWRKDDIFLQPAFDQGAFLASFLIPLFFLVSGAGMAKIEAKRLSAVVRGSVQLLAFAYLTHFAALALIVLIYLPEATLASALHGVQSATIETLRGVLQPPTIWFVIVLAVARLPLYLAARHAKGVAFWLLFSGIFLLTLTSPGMPGAFNMKSWAPALLWMMLGYKLAPMLVRTPWQVFLPAAVATWMLAPLNHGCMLDAAAACPLLRDRFFVLFPSGYLGYLPLFYPTAVLGCLAALSLSGILARVRFQPFGAIGRKTLQLMVVHGFVQALAFAWLATLPVPSLNPFGYLLIAVVAIATHMVLVRLLAAPLKALLRASFKVADASMDALALVTSRRRRFPTAPSKGSATAGVSSEPKSSIS